MPIGEVEELARWEMAFLLANGQYRPNSARECYPIYPRRLYACWRDALWARIHSMESELADDAAMMRRQRQRFTAMLWHLSQVESLL